MKLLNVVESLHVEHFSVCFEFCDDNHIPVTKNDVKIVLEALKSFSNIQLFNQRRPHVLDSNGKSEYIKLLIKRHEQKLYSIDAGKAGGKHGDKRIIFYYDSDNNSVVKILSLFFDDHSKR